MSRTPPPSSIVRGGGILTAAILTAQMALTSLIVLGATGGLLVEGFKLQRESKFHTNKRDLLGAILHPMPDGCSISFPMKQRAVK